MLLLRELQITNFLSHEKTNITFEENGSLLIDGVSGAGKTTIVEAIIWAIFGSGRSNNMALVHSGASEARVILIVTKNEKTIKIERKITSLGKHTLTVSELKGKKYVPVEVSGVKAVQAFIEREIVEASYALFVNSAASLQDNSDSFIKQNASKKKDILLEIIKAADYDDYYEKAKNEIRSRKESSALYSVEIQAKTESIKSDAELVDSMSSLIAEKEENQAKINVLRAHIENLRKKLEDNIQTNKEISKIEIEINLAQQQLKEKFEETTRISKEILSLEQDFAGSIPVTEVDIQHLVDLKKLKEFEENKRNASDQWLNKKLELTKIKPSDMRAVFEEQIKDINTKIIKIGYQESKICPITNVACPLTEKTKEDAISELTKELESVSNKLKDNEQLLSDYENKTLELGQQPVFAIAELNKLSSEIALLEERISKDNKQKESKAVIKEKQAVYEKVVVEMNDIKTKTGLLEAEKTRLSSLLDEKISNEFILKNKELYDYEQNMHSTLAKLEIAHKASEKVEKFKKDIQILNAKISTLENEMVDLEITKEAFGNNGIKSILIDYVLPQLEDKINHVLENISDFRVKLETQKSGISEDTLLEGLFITIINGQGESFDLNNYSGGEKVKISAAISEGLASLSKIGFRIMDESVIGLDNSTVESFVEVMLGIQERFKQIICISHIQAVKDIFPKQINVIKQNGKSYVR